MFTIPGILALLTFIYVRPQEIYPPLQKLPLLYLFLALALFGLAVDLKLRLSRPRAAPQLTWVILFVLWCLGTVVARAPAKIVPSIIDVCVPVTMFLVIAHGVQTFRAFQVLTLSTLAMVLFLALVGVHQGLSHRECILLDPATASTAAATGEPDGRPCEIVFDCYRGDPEPGADYLCEKVGLFGTTSIGNGRVRYRGVLQDPNELALAIGIGLPFAFAFFERRRSGTRRALLVLSLIMIALCTVMTKSRGGQLVLMAVLGTYFVKRYGVKGLAFGAVMGAPLLLFGGRSGQEASESSLERMECWFEGMNMFRQYPVTGVGFGQFTEYHFLTAHNSYILAPAELGYPGFVIWLGVMYISTKIPIMVLARARHEPEADVARAWAVAVLSGAFGLLVGSFFLSFNYSYILWIYVGICGALYQCVKTHDPEWKVKYGVVDFLAVAALAAFLCALLYAYSHLKLAGGR